MSVPEPHTVSPFWPRVKAANQWPEVDEDAVRELGDEWKAMGDNATSEAREILTSVLPALRVAWPDAAGVAMCEELHGRAEYALDALEKTVVGMANACYWGAHYAERLKWRHHQLIDAKRDDYETEDMAGREAIVRAIVDDLGPLVRQYSLDLLTDRKGSG